MKMLGKHGKLIMVVMLVTALAIGSASTVAQSKVAQSLDGNGATLDSDSADVRDRLIKGALPLINEGHFEPSNFDFTSSITSPSSKALFLPFKKDFASEDLNGLLYVDETIYIQNHRFIPGLYSVWKNYDQNENPLTTQEMPSISLDGHQSVCVSIGVSVIVEVSTQICQELPHGDPGGDPGNDDGAEEPESEGNCGEDGWAGGCPA